MEEEIKKRNDLATKNLRLIDDVISKKFRNFLNSDTYSEYWSVGAEALVLAAAKYNEDVGKFSTYAYTAICRAIRRHCATNTTLSIPERKLYKISKLNQYLSESPFADASEISDVFGWSLNESKIALQGISALYVSSLDNSAPQSILCGSVNGEDSQIKLEGMVCNGDISIEDQVQATDAAENVCKVIRTHFGDRTEFIVRQYYGIGCHEHTLAEIGKLTGMTAEAVRQNLEKIKVVNASSKASRVMYKQDLFEAINENATTIV